MKDVKEYNKMRFEMEDYITLITGLGIGLERSEFEFLLKGINKFIKLKRGLGHSYILCQNLKNKAKQDYMISLQTK